MDTPEMNWLALNLIPDLGIQTLRQLLRHYKSVDNLLRVSAEELVRQSGISVKMANRIANAKDMVSFQIERRLIEENGIQLICLESPCYPEKLREIPAPPPILYCQGDLQKIESPCIAVVGSRICTSYGKRNTKRLIFEMAEVMPNLVIVSGLARGIDTVAHQSALDAGLSTIAVLAGGLKHIYPPENYGLSQEIQSKGALISEFPMGMKPLARNFPIRNRIISGLSQGIVVTEAGQKSGALITAAFGLQHNREVFALPGNVEASTSRGANQLISRHHAKLVVHAKDILEELQVSYSKNLQTKFSFDFSPDRSIDLSAFSEHQRKIIKALDSGMQDIDSLYSETRIEINELLGLLVELELTETVQSLEGQRYQLNEAFQLENNSKKPITISGR